MTSQKYNGEGWIFLGGREKGRKMPLYFAHIVEIVEYIGDAVNPSKKTQTS